MTDWVAFYERFFPTREEAEEFVAECDAQAPPANAAKLIMHQAQRLVSLAEELPAIRPNRESLQVFMLVVCAEAVVKLSAGSGATLGSKEAVRRFFSGFVPPDQRALLESAFRTTATTPNRTMTLQQVADLFYEVRCDVAHEGVYWLFTLSPGGTLMHTTKPTIMTQLTITQLISCVVAGAIVAARGHL